MVPAIVHAAEGPGWPDQLPLLPHPAEIIVGLIAFAILYWIFAKKIVPNMEAMYAQRVEAIEGGMDKAEAAQREAEEAKRAYQAQLAASRDEAAGIREEAREQGATIIAEMRAQAQAEAARITEGAHKQIQAEHAQALVSLRSEVGRLSTDLASRIVGESLHDETRQSGIVDRFLADLESGRVRPEAVGHAAPSVQGAGQGGQH